MYHQIFVNLKRFDVPREKGGVCPSANPAQWIQEVMTKSAELGIGTEKNVSVVFLVPEALIVPAQEAASGAGFQVGCQSVFRDNIKKGGNFGAFTTNLPAASAYQLGCRWSIIGHSEERRDKQEIIAAYEPDWNASKETREKCLAAVDGLINRETRSALDQGIGVLLCMGETAEERGSGSFEEQQERVKAALSGQVLRGLDGVKEYLTQRSIVIGYEPIWAIGPGKTPPDSSYIAFVSSFLKEEAQRLYGVELPVVYGGGLKEENAAQIGAVSTIDGGLVALTRFTGEVGFYAEDLKIIIDKYRTGKEETL